ncbi:conserved hypothetical protein [Verticillium alfalfae VaMs.102]|uniref:Zn(2)-C6 fungal-type domain-containing protein n=1 Tax=Verticillium alfalfae (strain VaMs.102 / ATCC MYA-4576 / FGSC 10136) TaxID=526221 RepID=C9SWT5_VERA1|nr:conserved hypothetical protein [Verticillium alfalfae VaMs.102]EEY23476.1 conserved hypothetical protein [Verticillium alfalfae VaMs.102]
MTNTLSLVDPSRSQPAEETRRSMQCRVRLLQSQVINKGESSHLTSFGMLRRNAAEGDEFLPRQRPQAQVPPRSFRGCWTCRDRRVKCDERKPACQRCLQSGQNCRGYGVRLNWSASRQYRGFILSATVKQSGARSPISQPSETLTTTTSSSPSASASGLELGSADAFRTNVVAKQGQILPIETTRHATIPIESPRGILMRDAAPHEGSSSLSEDDQSPPNLTGEALSVPQDEPASQPHITKKGGTQFTLSMSAQDKQHQQISRSCPVTASRSSACGGSVTASRFACRQQQPTEGCPPVPMTQHVDFLSMPQYQKSLIFHWATFTSGKLMLVDSPDNAFRTAMLPKALSGISGLSTESNVNKAIFHSICAGSAFNLFELSGGKNPTLESLALNHQRLQLEHLRFNLGRQDDPEVRQSLGSAIMASIIVEAISGARSRWKTHLSGGVSYLRHLQMHGGLSHDQYEFRDNILRMALLCHWEIPSEVMCLVDRPKLDDANNFSGTTSSFFTNITAMNRLQGPETTEHEIDKFELQLYLSFPPAQSSRNASLDDEMAVEEHAARAFYYASLVYFQRTVRKASTNTVRSLVSIGLRELELIDTLSRGRGGCIALWPVLVLGSEASTCELKSRVTTWFQAKEAYGISNVRVIHKLLKDLWSRRSQDAGIRWQDLIAEENYDVFNL